MNEGARVLIAAWRRQADEVDQSIRFPQCSKWFSAMTDEEKADFRRRQTEATAIRGCANELERLLEKS